MFKKSESGQFSPWYILVVIVVIGILWLIMSVRVVDQAKSCTWVRFGEIYGEAKPGLQLTHPFNKKVCYSKQSILFQTASDKNGDGRVDSDADYSDFPVEIKTSDGQSAQVEFNLSFHVDPSCAPVLRDDVASNERNLVMRVVNNLSRSIPRDIAPRYSALELYGEQRIDFEEDIILGLPAIDAVPATDTTPEVSARPAIMGLREMFENQCVVLDEFSLRDINFSPEYEKVMEDKQVAMEGVNVQKYMADQAIENKRATVANAEAAADAAIEAARGQAETIRLLAIAEADAMEVKGQALKDFPEMLKLKFFDALSTANWMMVPWDDLAGYMPVQPQ